MLSCRMDPNAGYAQAYGELFARVYNRYWSSYAERAFTSITGFLRRADGARDRFREIAYETVFPRVFYTCTRSTP